MALGLVEPRTGLTGRPCVQAKADLRPYGSRTPTRLRQRRRGPLGGQRPRRAPARRRAAPRPRPRHRAGLHHPGADHRPPARRPGPGPGHRLRHPDLPPAAPREHVTATDISERALAFTRFNLLLNAEALHVDPAGPRTGSACGWDRCWSRWPGRNSSWWSPTRRSSSRRAAPARTRHGPVHLPRRRPAGGRHRGLAGRSTAGGPGPGRNSPAFGQLGDHGGDVLGGAAAKLGQSGHGCVVHPARAGGPGTVCRDLAAGRLGNPGPRGTTRTPTPPTSTTSPPGTWRASASA